MKRAIVLAGGGARGAYEAGVLLYISEHFARAGGLLPFEIVTGTSVGAIHACYLASRAGDFRKGAAELVKLWRSLNFADVLSSRFSGALEYPYYEIRSRVKFLNPRRLPRKMGGLFDTTPLEKMVLSEVKWRSISHEIRNHHIESLGVTATNLSTGSTVVFVETALPENEVQLDDDLTHFQKVRIRPLHALASSAIPFLFPSVRIGNSYYADGGVRMMTPLRPAIHLGAEAVLAISLKSAEKVHVNRSRVAWMPPSRMAGKVLNSFFIDRLEADARFASLINDILLAGEHACGRKFKDALIKLRRSTGKKPYRPVKVMLIRPSKDMGVIAAQHADKISFSLRPRKFFYSLLAKLLVNIEGGEDVDFLSYLLFDSAYASSLIDLGYSDAEGMHSRLEEFFGANS